MLNKCGLTAEGCLAHINQQSLITAVKCEHWNYTFTSGCLAKCPLSSINEGISVQWPCLNFQVHSRDIKWRNLSGMPLEWQGGTGMWMVLRQHWRGNRCSPALSPDMDHKLITYMNEAMSKGRNHF